jgi:hypothetical protein
MIKANEARARIEELRLQEQEQKRQNAIDLCEGEISRAIEGKVEEQKRVLTFKINENIDRQEVMTYLQEQGFTVNVSGIKAVDIWW